MDGSIAPLNRGARRSAQDIPTTLRKLSAGGVILADDIDWDAATAEATALLREYLRIDTSNPPATRPVPSGSSVTSCAPRESPSRRWSRRQNAPILFAPMGPATGGVCLLNHTDVVPVEREFWDVDPFAGELHDGVI